MASSPQQQAQYVSSMLAREGREAFPYDDEVKSLIQQHLLTLTHHFPALHVKAAEFTHNHGTTVDLLQAQGTIPMTTPQGIVYHIPISIWLVEDYPVASPLVFVTPTADMVIKRPHEHVDASGNVSLPYLSSWMYPQSNLVDLAKNLSSLFGRAPPLYSIAAHTANPPATGRSTSPSFSYPSPNSSVTPLSAWPSLHEAETRPIKKEPFHTGDPAEVFRNNATKALAERIKLDISKLQKASNADIEKLGKTQIQLQRKQAQMTEAMEQMQLEKGVLEQQIQILSTNMDIVQMWISSNQKVAATVKVDDAFEPCDPLSKQMLECISLDYALEDLLYHLDKAVQAGSIPMDAYLSQVRNLAREQFFHRATCDKVREAQTRIQVSRMAARYAL